MTGDRDLTNLEKFLGQLEDFAGQNEFNVMIILSANPESLPPGISKYC